MLKYQKFANSVYKKLLKRKTLCTLYDVINTEDKTHIEEKNWPAILNYEITIKQLLKILKKKFKYLRGYDYRWSSRITIPRD